MVKRKHRGLKVVAIIVCALVLCWLLLLLTNFFFTQSLRSYIKSFDPVDYSKEMLIEPTISDSDSYKYSYVLDDNEELNVMVLTDLHIGGGCWSHKKDMKTIYEVITMLQAEKPDLVILDGDNIFAVPGPVYNGGGTLNNKMVSKTVLELFEHEQVYFTTVFGNHDTEVFDYSKRQAVADLYEKGGYKYCIFHQDFTDSDADMPSVTNQLIPVKNRTTGKNVKLLMLVDSNAYVDNSIKSVIDWNYDAIHDAQVDWAKASVEKLSTGSEYTSKNGEKLGTLAFFHIPIGEYELAYRALAANRLNPTRDAKYVSGYWDELVDEDLGGRIWFGGCSRFSADPAAADKFFETLGPDGLNCLEGCFCGHDHVNNAVVEYRGVTLSYGNSLDNLAYTDVDQSGVQRGCTRITISSDGSWKQEHLNAYTDLGVDTQKYSDVYLDKLFYEGGIPENVK